MGSGEVMPPACQSCYWGKPAPVALYLEVKSMDSGAMLPHACLCCSWGKPTPVALYLEVKDMGSGAGCLTLACAALRVRPLLWRIISSYDRKP